MSTITSAVSSGLSTVATGLQQLSLDAQQVANPDAPDATASLLDMNQASELSQLGADVIRTSNQMLGTLLNIFA